MAEIEATIAKDGFWDNPEDSKSILKERTSISHKIDRFKKLWNDLEENQILLDLALEESDDATLEEVSQKANELDERVDQLSLDLMLDGARRFQKCHRIDQCRRRRHGSPGLG